jgi:hypothetical protein
MSEPVDAGSAEPPEAVGVADASFAPLLPKSRRTRPRAAHINGVAAGASPPPPPACSPKPSQDNSRAPNPETAVVDSAGAAAGADVMTGAADTVFTATAAGTATGTALSTDAVTDSADARSATTNSASAEPVAAADCDC